MLTRRLFLPNSSKHRRSSSTILFAAHFIFLFSFIYYVSLGFPLPHFICHLIHSLNFWQFHSFFRFSCYSSYSFRGCPSPFVFISVHTLSLCVPALYLLLKFCQLCNHKLIVLQMVSTRQISPVPLKVANVFFSFFPTRFHALSCPFCFQLIVFCLSVCWHFPQPANQSIDGELILYRCTLVTSHQQQSSRLDQISGPVLLLLLLPLTIHLQGLSIVGLITTSTSTATKR